MIKIAMKAKKKKKKKRERIQNKYKTNRIHKQNIQRNTKQIHRPTS